VFGKRTSVQAAKSVHRSGEAAPTVGVGGPETATALVKKLILEEYHLQIHGRSGGKGLDEEKRRKKAATCSKD